MTLYGIANYVHVLGSMGIVAALCLEWIILLRLRAAETREQARPWFGLAGIQRLVGPASLAALLLGGVYMAATRWGGAGWISVGLLALVLIAALGAYNGIRLDRIRKSVPADSGPLVAGLQERIRHPSFVTSIHVRAGLLLGVVYLMVTKLDLSASLMTMGLALLIGLISALPAWRRPTARRVAHV